LSPEQTLGGRWNRLLVGGIPDPERPLQVEAGEWYFGVYCGHCTAPVPVFHDRGRGNLIAIGGGTLTVTCRHCGTEGSYGTDSMISFFIEDTAREKKP
jgi:hypothetical protein